MVFTHLVITLIIDSWVSRATILGVREGCIRQDVSFPASSVNALCTAWSASFNYNLIVTQIGSLPIRWTVACNLILPRMLDFQTLAWSSQSSADVHFPRQKGYFVWEKMDHRSSNWRKKEKKSDSCSHFSKLCGLSLPPPPIFLCFCYLALKTLFQEYGRINMP